MRRLTAIISGLIVVLILTTGCDEGQLTGTTTDNERNKSTEEQEPPQSQNEVIVVETTEYDFNDLASACTWNNDNFPNPYNDLVFDETPRWAICNRDDISGMSGRVLNPLDSQFFSGTTDVIDTTIIHLPEPVDSVSINTANYRESSGQYLSILIAYDEHGNEIGNVVNDVYYHSSNTYHSQILKVSGDANSRIHSIGIAAYQDATYLDNLRLVVTETQANDATPPEITYTVEKESLWPPSNKMELVVSGISASDDSGEDVILQVSVKSNELVNGDGDNNTSPDWEIVENENDSIDVWVRAERSGTGSGRIYTITIHAVDSYGNEAMKTVEIFVPHNQEE